MKIIIDATSKLLFSVTHETLRFKIKTKLKRQFSYLPMPVVFRKVLVLSCNDCFVILKETKSAAMNIFRFFYFLFKSFVKVELSYVFTINLFTIAANCTEK